MSKKTIAALTERHGERHEADITRGVRMCHRVWDFERDGRKAFHEFCLTQYVPPGKQRRQLLARLDEFHHQVIGAISVTVKVARAGQDMADRPALAAEEVLAGYTPDTHLREDYRRFRIAALVQLNFGTDEERSPRGRAGWAARQLAHVGREVIPADAIARYGLAVTEADRFISSYNLHLDRFRYADRSVKFPRGTRQVSHWGLRDYMMSLNGARNPLPRQRAILDLMRRVVDGQVPREVLDDPEVVWDIPNEQLIRGKRKSPARGHGPLRWQKFHQVWQAQRAIDPHTRHGNLIDNKFLLERQLPESQVVGMLTAILSSPLAERIGRFVRAQLGRELEPFDIYYRDFEGDGPGKAPLDYDVRKRFPTAGALQEAIPEILVGLGWGKRRARWIGERIRVDNGRSAGHAWPPQADHDLQLLRVRVDRGGCDELNFETYMHELGHCVEGVLTSYEMDYKLLWGVPNTAFTEGFAFTFQDRTDQVLGRQTRPPSDELTLLRFWEPLEIGGAALTELRFFHWLYANPDATPGRMMRAIRRIGDQVWREFYARVFGPDGHGLLSVYSHVLWGDLYLAEYPLGHIIAYQISRFLRGRSLPREMERMCGLGRIAPEAWMRAAVGEGISVQPLLDDTAAALDRLGY